jgi:nitric oxide reductase subunit B
LDGDWLHRESTFVLDDWAQSDFSKAYEQTRRRRSGEAVRTPEKLYRHNGYDAATNTITIEPVRARAFESCLAHFSNVFMKGNAAYAIPSGSVSTPERMRQFAGFMFWTGWSAAAERPGDTVSYTHNWPYDPQIGNRPTGESVIWTGVSIIMLLAGICAVVWWYASQNAAEPHGPIPHTDPLGA